MSAHYDVTPWLSPTSTSTNQYFRLPLSKCNSPLYPFLLFSPYAFPLPQNVQTPAGARPVYCLHQIAWSLLARGEEASCSGGETQRTQLQTCSLLSKNIISQPVGLCSFFEAIRFLTKGNYNKTQSTNLTEAVPSRQTMYSNSQQSRCFWKRYNYAWPCRPEPNSDRTVPITAVCSSGIELSDPHSKTRATLESGCPHTVLSQEHGQGETPQGKTVLSWYPRTLESR